MPDKGFGFSLKYKRYNFDLSEKPKPLSGDNLKGGVLKEHSFIVYFYAKRPGKIYSFLRYK